ncbi:inversin isoform X3 [Callorhinchus milii]|nr:inversin isoform X3 [Callorhinchus milii]
MKLLLSRRANWMQKDLEEMTPLHLATRHKSAKCLALLLKFMAPGEVDTQDRNKQTALHWSAYYNHPEHVKLLIKHDSNIGIPDIEGKIPLHWAANNKDATAIHTVKCILEAAPTESLLNWQDYEGRTPLHFAVADGNKAVVDVLTLYEGCNITSYDNLFRTPLHWAALLGHAQIGHLLLERNKSGTIPSDSQGATPLHYAAQSNFAETVEVFLNHPSVKDDPDLEGRTAFMWAAGKGSDDVMRTMLRLKSDIDINISDKYGGTALHAAALSGHVSTVKLLLEYGAQVDALDVMKHTPLFRACEMGHREVIQTLIKGGARVDLVDQDGHSPLHWAALGGNADVCQILIQNQINPNVQDYAGRTPLQCAAYGGYINCMAVLMENKADPNIQDKEGRTALHWSCNNGYLDAVKLLLGYDSFPNHMETNEERYTPLDYALLGEHQEVIQYMLEHGALSIAAIQDIAASKIQAVYKGYKVRKAFQERKNLLMKHEQLRKDAAKKRGEEKRKEAALQKEKRSLESQLDAEKPPGNLELVCPPLNRKNFCSSTSECDQLELRIGTESNRLFKSRSQQTSGTESPLRSLETTGTTQSRPPTAETETGETKRKKERPRSYSKSSCIVDHQPTCAENTSVQPHSSRQLIPSESGSDRTGSERTLSKTTNRLKGRNPKRAGFRSASTMKKMVKPPSASPSMENGYHIPGIPRGLGGPDTGLKCGRFSPAGSSRPGSAKPVVLNSVDTADFTMHNGNQTSDINVPVLDSSTPNIPANDYLNGTNESAQDRMSISQSLFTEDNPHISVKRHNLNIQLIPLEVRLRLVEKERIRKELFRKKNQAATVIQKAWRSYKIHKGLLQIFHERQKNGVSGNDDETWKQELAAFTVQLVWRKYLDDNELHVISTQNIKTFSNKSSRIKTAKQHTVLKQIYGNTQNGKGCNGRRSSTLRSGQVYVQLQGTSESHVKDTFQRNRSACNTLLNVRTHTQLMLRQTHLSDLQHVQRLVNLKKSKEFSYNMRPHTSTKTHKARTKE